MECIKLYVPFESIDIKYIEKDEFVFRIFVFRIFVFRIFVFRIFVFRIFVFRIFVFRIFVFFATFLSKMLHFMKTCLLSNSQFNSITTSESCHPKKEPDPPQTESTKVSVPFVPNLTWIINCFERGSGSTVCPTDIPNYRP